MAVKGEALADHKAGASLAVISGRHGKAQAPDLGHVLLCLIHHTCTRISCYLPILRDIFGVAAQELLCKSGKIEFAQSCAAMRGISGHCDAPVRPGAQLGVFGSHTTFHVWVMAIPRNGEVSPDDRSLIEPARAQFDAASACKGIIFANDPVQVTVIFVKWQDRISMSCLDEDDHGHEGSREVPRQ